jgi:hypothetical protein
MGFHKVVEKYAEWREKDKLFHNFAETAQAITQMFVDSEKALKDDCAVMDKIRLKIEQLTTFGEKEFEDYKKSLLGIAIGGGTPRPLPIDPVRKAMARARQEKETKPAEYEAKMEVWGAFEKAAKQINESQQKYKNVSQTLEQLAMRVAGMNTLDIKEFEDYKKSLLGILAGGTPRPLPLEPLRRAVVKVSNEHYRLVKDHRGTFHDSKC